MKILTTLILSIVLSVTCFAGEADFGGQSAALNSQANTVQNSGIMTRTGSYFFSGPSFSLNGSEMDFNQAFDIFQTASPLAFNYLNESQSWYKRYKTTMILYGVVGGLTLIAIVAVSAKSNDDNSKSWFKFGNAMSLVLLGAAFTAYSIITWIIAGIQMNQAMNYADKAVNAYNSGRRVSFNNEFRFDSFIPAGQSPAKFNGLNFIVPVVSFQF